MNPISVAKPELGEEEAILAGKVIRSGWVTQGPMVEVFENDFRSICGAPFACACSNCTVALHMALLAVGVRPGDVVLTVSHSFIATANAIRQCGADPVFVDIDPLTLNLSPDHLQSCLEHDFLQNSEGLHYRHVDRLLRSSQSPLRSAVKPIGRLGAILVVHQLGIPADLGRILPIARGVGIPVVEDAACAVGSSILVDGKWQPIGKPHSTVACFSFHPRKVITTGDGGMMTTADPEIDRLFRLLRQHGMSISDANRHDNVNVVFEEYLTTAFNYRMTDIQASVGVEQLKRLPGIVSRRREIAALYERELGQVPGVTTPKEPPYAKTNWQSYMLRLSQASWQVPIMQRLLDHNISTRRGVMCAHREPPYLEAWNGVSLSESEKAQDHGIILPLHTLMSDIDVMLVAKVLRQILREMY